MIFGLETLFSETIRNHAAPTIIMLGIDLSIVMACVIVFMITFF